MDTNALQGKLEQVRHLLRAGQTGHAEEILRELLTGYPDLPPALALLSEVHAHLGRHGEARSILARLVELEPDRAENFALLGKALLNLGEEEPARAAFARALELEPRDFGAAFGLGALALAKNQTSEAEAWFGRAVENQPDNHLGRFHLAEVLLSLGRPADAAGHLEAATRLTPQNPRYAARLGEALLAAGREGEALAALNRSVELGGGPPALLALGKALVGLGRAGEATALFAGPLERNPGDPALTAALAGVLLAAGRHAEAAAHYRRALAALPQKATWWRNLGLALEGGGDSAGAAEAFGRALEIAPGLTSARQDLANSLEALGDKAGAAGEYRRILAREPARAEAWYGLAKVEPPAPDGPEDRAMAELLARGRVGKREEALLLFARANILDKAGRSREAFRHYCLANAADQDRHRFDPDEHQTLARRIMDTFTAGFIRQNEASLPESAGVILIVGMPRSGTTLVEQVLASHSSVFGAGELGFLEALPLSLASPEPYPACLCHLGPDRAAALGRDYLAAVAGLKGAAPFVTDKLPRNYLHLGLAALVLPGAKVVQVVRDPLDCCLSQFFQRFNASGLAYTTSFEHLALVYRAYLDLMDHWRAVLPAPFLQVSYAQLVEDFPAQAARLLDFCGLPWEEGVLEFHRTSRRVATASSGQVRQGLNRAGLNRADRYGQAVEPLRQALLQAGVPL